MTKTKSKNRRRIAAAENALRRVQPLNPSSKTVRNKQRKPKISVPQAITSRVHSPDALRYAHSIINNYLYPGLRLPDFGNGKMSMPYDVIASYSPQAGASGNFGAYINPYVLPFNSLSYDTLALGVYVTNAVGGLVTTATGATTNMPDGASGNTTTINLTGVVASGSAYQYWVRPHAVEIDIEYLGSELNMGGQLQIKHAHNGTSPLVQSTSKRYDAPAFLGTSSPQAVSRMAIGRRARFVLHPSCPEYANMQQTYATNIISAAVTESEYNQQLHDSRVLQMPVPGSNLWNYAPYGWTMGFEVDPAVSVASTPNYRVTVRSVGDIVMENAGSAGAASAGATPTVPPHSNPQDEALIRNALSQAHIANVRGNLREVVARSANGFVNAASSTAAQMAARALPKIASSAGASLATSLMTRLLPESASSLPLLSYV